MYTKNTQHSNRIGTLCREAAVSPVVGVMLMLVVTIIIAAVVSGFAGGLVGGTSQKAPTLTMDVSIANNGVWSGSHFSAKVTGVDQAISTKDLKIVTTWNKIVNGSTIGNVTTIVAGTTNTNLNYKPCAFMTNANWKYNSPLGYGTGVTGKTWPWQPYAPLDNITSLGSSFNLAPGDSRGDGRQWYGNYSLVTGTTMYAEPFGHGDGPTGGQTGTGFTVGYGVNNALFNYTYGADASGNADFEQTDTDQMMAVLGTNWYNLRAGDTVNVRVVYVPSGKTILNKDVTVEG
ncbi:MAG: type IV pilin N-terminal domain-containing protein [Methanoregula sp.]|nr:type IV pilin N-terminal domain-containing protein [Methanoregula sp.]